MSRYEVAARGAARGVQPCERPGAQRRPEACSAYHLRSLDAPHPDSYRVADGFLAGEYPGSADPDQAARRLRAFADHGVTLFVDLTHPGDPLEPYDALLGGGARRASHPIVDMGTTTVPHMTRILDEVDSAIEDGGTATSIAGAASAGPAPSSAAG